MAMTWQRGLSGHFTEIPAYSFETLLRNVQDKEFVPRFFSVLVIFSY